MNIIFLWPISPCNIITAYVLNELEFHCLCVRNEIRRVRARNEQCVDYCVKLQTIAKIKLSTKTFRCGKLAAKIVDGDVNPYCRYTAAGFFVCNSIYWWSRGVSKRDYCDHIQRRIQGKGSGGLGSPLFLDRTEARGARKKYFLRPPPPPPFLPSFYLRIWMTGSTPYLKVSIR